METSQSPAVQTQTELQEVTDAVLTEAEQEQKNILFTRIVDARSQRDMIRREFDDLGYEQDYLLNQQAMNSYLRPKINDDEVRIVTGTTEKRIEFVANELLAMNLQPQVRAFDDNDNELVEVGSSFEDIVRRTNEIEQDEDMWVDAIQELLSQRAVFVEELWIDKAVGKQRKRYCQKRVLSGLQVYLGDISIPYWRFNDQPYILKYERMDYNEAKGRFEKEFDNFEFVRPGAYNAYTLQGNNLYRANSLQKNEVEILCYMSYGDNEMQIYIQGIPMLDVGTKYTDVVGNMQGYHISMNVLKTMGLSFAYGKPLTASAKTLQALDNETIRNMIRKFRQAIEPPLGVKSGRIYSRDIWSAGSVTQGISDKDYTKLIDHQGVTQSEFSMFDLIEKKTNDFIGANQVTPLQGKSKVTATEILQGQKIATKMLGYSVLAVMRMKRNCTFPRIYNVIHNYSKPMGKRLDPISKKIREMYAMFTIKDSELDAGKTGTKVIQFTGEPMSEARQFATYAFEKRSEKKGENMQYLHLNIQQLKDLSVNWFVSVITKERDSSELSKAMFQDKLSQGVQVAQIAQRPINANKLTESFERVWKEKDFFQKEAPQPAGMAPAPGAENGGSGLGALGQEQSPGGLDGLGSQSPQGGSTPANQMSPKGMQGRPSLNELV